jgi:uncharacterized delta-60 repeat protein
MKAIRRLCFLAIAAFVLISVIAPPCALAAPGDLDPLDADVVGNFVVASVVQPDGKMIIAGRFSSVLGVPRRGIARLNADGTLDADFDPQTNSSVLSVAVQADGKILLGGFFTTLQPNGAVSPTPRNNIARVNADGTLDASFDPNPNGSICSVVVQADGKILLGGSFTTLQPNGAVSTTPRQNIARVNADGTLDTGFDPTVGGGVCSVAVQADGKILLGGSFFSLQPNGAAVATWRNNIARVNADGTLDIGFDPNANYIVYSVAVQGDGKILLGGNFTTLQPNGAAEATTRNNLARVNADGTLDTGFDPKPNNYAWSLALQADGKILVGGGFSTLQPNGAVAETSRIGIARLNTDGTLDTGFDPNANDTVDSLAVQADGKIVIGGQFTTLQPNGATVATTRNHFARLDNDAAIQSLGVPSSTQVLWQRGGAAPEVSQVTFELSTNGGTTWAPLPGTASRVGATANWQLTGLSLPASGQLRASGRTLGGNRNGSSGIVQQVKDFGPAGSLEVSLDADVRTSSGQVSATAVQADGKIILVGKFWEVLGKSRNNIARLNADGTLDTGFDPNTNAEVNCVAVQADGKVVIGGWFETLQPNGAGAATLRSGIARLNTDGTLDTGFDPHPNRGVHCVVIQADGKLLIGGDGGISRLNADGTLDTGFDPRPGGYVYSIAVQSDGKVLIGGFFSTLRPNGAVTATPRGGIARVNADGTLDTDFDPNADHPVSSLVVQPDGKVLIGGEFTQFRPNGAAEATPRKRIARLNADGSLDASFDPTANAMVYSVALQADGKILLGGDFTTLQPNGAVRPTPRNGIARVNADGTLDPGFNPNANGSVNSVVLQADGKILLGGQFTTLQPNGATVATPRNLFARLNNDAAIQSLGAPSATQVLWQRGGAAPEFSQVTFELSTDGGTTWAPLPGTASRVGATANWQLTGLSLPASGLLRARGRTAGGFNNGSSGIVQQVAGFSGPRPGAAGWRMTQLSTIPNAADGARTGAAHSSWYLYYYKGTDSNIWCTYWTGTQWTQVQLNSGGNVDDWLTFGTAYNLLCYKGKDNRLWAVYYDGTMGWTTAILGTDTTVAGDVVIDTGWNIIYYRRTDSRVWAAQWNGVQWTHTSLGGTPTVQGSLAVDDLYHLVYYRGTDNQLSCYSWSGTAWVQVPLTTTANVGGSVAADTGGGLAYYRSSADNSAWCTFWTGAAWSQVQLDPLAGIGTANSIAPLSKYVVFYLTSSGQCAAEYWNGTAWGNILLGDGGAGLTGGLSVQRSTNLTFARRADGQVVVFYYQ